MHQDYPFFPHTQHTMVAAILHFDDAPEEKGCVRVVPGSHKQGPLEHEQAGGWHLPFEQYPLESSTGAENSKEMSFAGPPTMLRIMISISGRFS